MDDNIERIDRYLTGVMTVAEKEAFEAELASSPALAEEVAVQRDMLVFLKQQEKRARLKSQLGEIGKDYFQKVDDTTTTPKVIPFVQRRRIWLALATAAAVIALLIVGRWITQPSLFEEYADFPPLALAEKSSNAVDWSQAERSFQSGNYSSAASLLADYRAQHPHDALAGIYLGICRMELGQTDEARQIFTSFTNVDPGLQDFADWCLALNYLKADDRTGCRQVLLKIQPSSAYYEKAQELLRDL